MSSRLSAGTASSNGRQPPSYGEAAPGRLSLPTAIIELIYATTIDTGLTIRAERDTEWYATGVKITDAELDALPLTRHDWHGDWNYTLAATPPA